MIDIERPQVGVEFVSDDEKYGKFTVEPLERGYGITLGNSLRRIMLSSLPGVAVQSIKIDGVSHEFSTIPGVKEDVTEIILNIKGLIAKLYSDGPKVVYIEATGEQEVTAADIKTDSDVEILNPDLHIASLGKDGRLFMSITLNKGRGYVQAGNVAGGTRLGILFKHIVPNGMGPVLSNSILQMAQAVLTEASLSFLGLGDPNKASWGLILNAGQKHINSAPWLIIYPGIALALLLLAFNLIGTALHKTLNVKQTVME